MEDVIRKGTLDDAAAMARIYNHYVAVSTVIFSNKQLSDSEMCEKLLPIVEDGYPFYVYERGGVVTGYIYAHAWQPDEVYAHTWELAVYVDKDCRGDGVGSRLLERLVDACREDGRVRELIACVTEGNAASERLHKAAGFERVSRFVGVGYKFGKWLNDVHYQLYVG